MVNVISIGYIFNHYYCILIVNLVLKCYFKLLHSFRAKHSYQQYIKNNASNLRFGQFHGHAADHLSGDNYSNIRSNVHLFLHVLVVVLRIDVAAKRVDIRSFEQLSFN